MIQTEWIFGLLGGLVIGSAAALFLLLNGRIMGASGLLGGLIDGSARHDARVRLAFVAGLIVVPAVMAATIGVAPTHVATNPVLLILAGLCVGIGTRLANGCTSGHGVCGISRLSWRGIVATLCYLGAGFAVMALARHGLGVI